MSDDPLNFEEHRRRREEDAGTVRCARCKRWVAAATGCLECGDVGGGRCCLAAAGDGRQGARAGLTPQSSITVWEARTGRLVKSWPGTATAAFHPSRPVPAVLEWNGEQTRLGLWD
jgi:hypothetical protein